MRLLSLSMLIIGLFLAGCTATQPGTGEYRDATAVRDVNATDIDVTSGIDLDTYLRRLPGVSVRGSGTSAQVQIRSNSSFGTGSAPLFVVNGSIIGTSYSKLLSTVDPAEIASVRVLKSASETAAYGLQGGNGVLEFKLK